MGMERSRRSPLELGLLWRQREPEAPLHADLPHPPDRRLGLQRKGGELPDLYASELKVMRKDQGKLLEDSSRNLSTHDDLLMQALGIPNAEFQPGSLERTGAKVIVRHPGYRMILLEDIG